MGNGNLLTLHIIERYFKFHILKCETAHEFLMNLSNWSYLYPCSTAWLMYCDIGRHTQTTRRSDRRVAVMCVGSTDAQRRQAWVRGWGSGFCSFCWLSKQQRGQSEWERPCEVTSWRDTQFDTEWLIKRTIYLTYIRKRKGIFNATLYVEQYDNCWHFTHFVIEQCSMSVWGTVAEGGFYNPNADACFWMRDFTAASVIAICGCGCAINCIVHACVCTCSCMNTPILVFLLFGVSHFSLSHGLTVSTKTLTW